MASVLDLAKSCGVRLGIPVAQAVGSPDPLAAGILAAMADAADDLTGRYPLNRQLPNGRWLRDASGKLLSSPGSDADTVLIEETLLRVSTLWRWREKQGLDYAEDFRAAEEKLSRLAADWTKRQRGASVTL